MSELETMAADVQDKHDALMHAQGLPTYEQIKRERDALADALKRIEKWQGEFPETNKLWPGGMPMSYAAAYGSNGERDYMRAIARDALSQVRK